MSMDEDIGEKGGDSILVAEYVLGLLDTGAAEALERRFRTEPELVRGVQFWRSRFALLDSEFEDVPAPPGILAAIEGRLYGNTRPTAFGGWWNNLAVWRGLAAASLAVAVVAVGFNLLRPVPLAPEEFATQLVAALQAQEGSGVEFVALYDSRQGAVRLVSVSGQSVPDRDYELWAIEGEAAPVSVGIVAIEGRSQMPIPPAVGSAFGEGTVLAVTIEPKGGSPSGAPTGPIVAMGPATSI